MTHQLKTNPKTTLKTTALLLTTSILAACGGSDSSSNNSSDSKDSSVKQLTKLTKTNTVIFDVAEKTQKTLDAKKVASCASSVDKPVFTALAFSNKVSVDMRKRLTIKKGVFTASFTNYTVPDNTVHAAVGTLTVDCKKPDGTLYKDPKRVSIKVSVKEGKDTDANTTPTTDNNNNTSDPAETTNPNTNTTPNTNPDTSTTPDTTQPNTTQPDTSTPTADTTAPVLSTTSKTFTTTAGTPLTLATVTATDAVDGTVAVSKTGAVDFSKAGTYKVTYTAKDKAGNVATAAHSYVVNEKVMLPNITSVTLEAPTLIKIENNSKVDYSISSGANTVKFTVNVSGSKSVVKTIINSVEYAGKTANVTINISPGEIQSYDVKVVDADGNTSPSYAVKLGGN